MMKLSCQKNETDFTIVDFVIFSFHVLLFTRGEGGVDILFSMWITCFPLVPSLFQ